MRADKKLTPFVTNHQFYIMNCLVHFIFVLSLINCIHGAKLIVATGFTEKDGFVKTTEVIDLDNANSKCLPWADSPVGVQSAVGGMVNDGFLLCGGSSFMGDSQQCHLITPIMAEQTVGLTYASFDSSVVVLDQERLFVIGGVNFEEGGELNRTEYVSTLQSTLGPNLPQDLLVQYCAHKIDEDTVMVIGGKTSYFFSIKTEKWRKGPDFQKSRSVHSCGSFKLNNHVVSIAAGGDYSDEASDGAIVELLVHLDDEESVWIEGPRLPYATDFGFKRQIVFNEDELFFVDGYTNIILKLVCEMELNSCHWKELEQKLDIPRLGSVMALIPEEFASCTTTEF